MSRYKYDSENKQLLPIGGLPQIDGSPILNSSNAVSSGGTYAALGNKQDKLQFATMPMAGETYLGKTVQYTGTTANGFTHNYLYECVSDGESTPTYSWQQTNVQPSSGGGGGHTIEDSEGTDLTQRDAMQFGEGFIAEDDSTNEKTVITPDVMQSGDMDDVLTPLPSVQPQYPRYSTSERVIGYWIDGKPLYERVFNPTISSNNQTFVTVATIPSLDTLAFVQALAGNNGEWELESSAYTENNDIKAKHGWTAATVSIDWVVTARYTKTTD